MLSPVQQQSLRAPRSMSLHSVAFSHGKQLAREYTGYGEDVSPPLEWRGVPPHTKALAIVVDDADAPGGTFTHWTLWNLPARIEAIEGGAKVLHLGGMQGRNDFGTVGYRGPKPPSGTHRYFFRIFALDRPLDLGAGAAPDDVWRALGGHTIAWGELVGTFTKP